jgi:HK97 family phage prohead protease
MSKKDTKTAEQKSARFQVKATDDEAGTFEAVVSVFGNVDSYGDRMVKGAFADTLKEWEDRGAAIPFLWDHAISDPFAYVGELTSAKETDEGLHVKGRFDMDDDYSRKAYRLMKSGRVREFSFGFFVKESGFVENEEDGFVREVKAVDLIEVSMTQIGANRETRLVEVRSAPDGRPEVRAASAESSAGVVQSVSTEDLDAVIDALDAALATGNEALGKLKAARKSLEDAAAKEGGDDDEKSAVILNEKSGNVSRETDPAQKKDHEQAAASSPAASDEDSTGSKSGARMEAAAATVRDLEVFLSVVELEKEL